MDHHSNTAKASVALVTPKKLPVVPVCERRMNRTSFMQTVRCSADVTSLVAINGHHVMTAPLEFGTDIDLIALSHMDALERMALAYPDDELDPDLSLHSITVEHSDLGVLEIFVAQQDKNWMNFELKDAATGRAGFSERELVFNLPMRWLTNNPEHEVMQVQVGVELKGYAQLHQGIVHIDLVKHRLRPLHLVDSVTDKMKPFPLFSFADMRLLFERLEETRIGGYKVQAWRKHREKEQ